MQARSIGVGKAAKMFEKRLKKNDLSKCLVVGELHMGEELKPIKRSVRLSRCCKIRER